MTSQTVTSRPNNVALGVTLMVSAVFMMSIQEALLKLFSDELSMWQLFTLRGLLALPIFIVLALAQKNQSSIWSGALRTWPLLRSLFMTMMFIVVYAALPLLSLSTIAAGVYTAPVFVTLLSIYSIGEPVGARGWIGISIGFAGVLVILQPGADAFTFWALLPVLGGFLYALSNITTRARCQDASLAALSLSLNLVLLLAGIVLSVAVVLWKPANELSTGYPFLFNQWSAVGSTEWLIIAVLAALLVVIQMALSGAYKSAPASSIATFDYSYLVFVVLWDLLIFSTPPTVTTMAGMLMIIAAGVLVVRRR